MPTDAPTFPPRKSARALDAPLPPPPLSAAFAGFGGGGAVYLAKRAAGGFVCRLAQCGLSRAKTAFRRPADYFTVNCDVFAFTAFAFFIERACAAKAEPACAPWCAPPPAACAGGVGAGAQPFRQRWGVEHANFGAGGCARWLYQPLLCAAHGGGGHAFADCGGGVLSQQAGGGAAAAHRAFGAFVYDIGGHGGGQKKPPTIRHALAIGRALSRFGARHAHFAPLECGGAGGKASVGFGAGLSKAHHERAGAGVFIRRGAGIVCLAGDCAGGGLFGFGLDRRVAVGKRRGAGAL